MADSTTDKPAKRHGSAKVGVGAPPPVDANRLIGRRARLADALKRADGARKTSLQNELASIDEQLLALQKALAAAMSPTPAA